MDPFLPHPLTFSATHSSSFSSSSSSSTSTTYIDPLFSGLTFQTLLSLNPSLFSSSLSDHHPPPPPLPPPPFNLFHHHPPPCRAVIPHMRSNLARQRRQKLSEKNRCLQKLMPWDTKMDQATLLHHAYKYVKFLQAQLTLLQSMPHSSSSHTSSSSSFVGSDLERLNRNQLLQVLVNSPVAQTMLCSQGFCVFSMEHLFLLTKDISFSPPDQIIMHASLNNNNTNNTS